MGGQRKTDGMSPRQLEQAHRLQLGEQSGEMVRLMAAKQDEMVAWGWMTEHDLRHINKWHLMSAELVIADLLRKPHGGTK